MKAIVLSAGQGRRLLPLTEKLPKCLLPIQGQVSALEFQLRRLAECGVTRATVMVGFGADRVERALHTISVPGLAVEACYNPFYGVADNLVTCWLARHAMSEDFILLNGDTLFLTPVLEQLLLSKPAPLTLAINHKPHYDDDDMKVSIDDEGHLLAIGKTLKPEMVNGESIGLLCFRGSGTKRFCEGLDRSIRVPGALKAWYLSVVNELAQEVAVDTASVHGFWWREIDSVEDLEEARRSHPDGFQGRPLQVAVAGGRS